MTSIEMAPAADSPIRVLITGSREFTDRSAVAAALTQVWRERGGRPLIVCHGTARGADRLAGAIARSHPGRLIEEPHPADWAPNGVKNPRAGFERNQLMIDLGADVCLAFFKNGATNNGTRHAAGAARRAGIEVREHWQL